MAASSPQLRAAFTAPAWSLKHVYLGRPCAIRRSPPRPGEGYGLPPRGDGQPGIGRSGSKRGEAARGMAQGRGGAGRRAAREARAALGAPRGGGRAGQNPVLPLRGADFGTVGGPRPWPQGLPNAPWATVRGGQAVGPLAPAAGDAVGRVPRFVLPRRVCCSRRRAVPVQHVRTSEQAQEGTSPEKINVTSKSQLRHISCHTDKNRYYT